MNETAFNFLTDQQARQLIRRELENFFSENSVKIKSEKSEVNVVDLNGLLKARPFIGSRSTIYKKVSRGEIPHSKNGKRLIFDLKIIDEWLLSNKVKTSADIEEETLKYFQRKRRQNRR